MDRRSLQVINSLLKLSEITEHDVVRIERIENNRKDDPSTEAIYFLTPSRQIVSRLIADFPSTAPASGPSHPQHHQQQHGHRGFSGRGPSTATRHPKYRAGHVYFTSELSNYLFGMVNNSGIKPYIKALRELCTEYDVDGSRVFTTRLADRPFYRLYSPLVTRGFNDELELVSKKLANVCGALKEDPVVRYLLLDPETYGDTKARPLAFLFHTEMDRIREGISANDRDNKQQAELILIDRSADPFAPILHEFTYEAMVHDLLDVRDGNKVTYMAELANGAKEEKTLVLDESDATWQEFRFQHISDAQQGIVKKYQGFVSSNKNIVGMQSGQGKVDMHVMRDAVANMPQYKDQLTQLYGHIALMEQCMDLFEKRKLYELAMLEQNLVTGLTPEGEKYTSGDIDIAYILNNPDIDYEDKLRLLLIFYISNPSLTEPERQKLARLAKLSRESRKTIENMNLLIHWNHALDLLNQIKNQGAKDNKNNGNGFGKWGLAGMRAAASGIGNKSNEDENKPYDVSRYVPALKSVLQGCIEGSLSEDLFPYVVPPERPREQNNMPSSTSSTPSGDRGSGGGAGSMWATLANSVGLNTTANQNAGTSSLRSSVGSSYGNNNTPARQIKSLRSAKPTWQKRDSSPSVNSSTAGGGGGAGAGAGASLGGMTGSTASNHSSAATATHVSTPVTGPSHLRKQSGLRPRIIVFVVGGITYSEIRAAEEISAKYDREVVIGSTHMIQPPSFLSDMSSLTFEIVGDNNRVLDMRPSFITLGYGGPDDVDPLAHYDEELAKTKFKPESKNKPRPRPDGNESNGSSRRGRGGYNEYDGDSDYSGHRRGGSSPHGSASSSSNRSRSKSREHGGGRYHHHHYPERDAEAEYRSMHGAEHSGSSGSSMNVHGNQQRRAAGRMASNHPSGDSYSQVRGGNSGPGMRSASETPMGSSNYGSPVVDPRSRRPPPPPAGAAQQQHQYPSPSRRVEQSASPTMQRGNERGRFARGDGGEPQDFRSGYDEYRRQQRQQQRQHLAAQAGSPGQHPKSLQTSPNPGMNRYANHPSRSHTQPSTPQPMGPSQTPMTKEELFRAKFEKSQREWDAQKQLSSHINPSQVSAMHKVSLHQESDNSSGNGGRGRSGSGGDKGRFLRRAR